MYSIKYLPIRAYDREGWRTSDNSITTMNINEVFRRKIYCEGQNSNNMYRVVEENKDPIEI